MDGNLYRLIQVIVTLMEYLSFWLVAPELLGEERIKQIEQKTEVALENFLKTREHYVSQVLLDTMQSDRLAIGTTIVLMLSFIVVFIFKPDEESTVLIISFGFICFGTPIILTMLALLLIFGMRIWLRLVAGGNLLRWRLLQFGAFLFTVTMFIKIALVFIPQEAAP